MNKVSSLLASVVLGFLVFGCASAPQGPAFLESRAKSPSPDKATVYIYRKHAEPTAWPVAMHIGQTKVASLKESGFTWLQVSPGAYEVRAVWSGLSGQKDSHLEVNLEKGKTYYLEVTGVSSMAGTTSNGVLLALGSKIDAVPAQDAERALAQCCRFQTPEISSL